MCGRCVLYCTARCRGKRSRSVVEAHGAPCRRVLRQHRGPRKWVSANDLIFTFIAVDRRLLPTRLIPSVPNTHVCVASVCTSQSCIGCDTHPETCLKTVYVKFKVCILTLLLLRPGPPPLSISKHVQPVSITHMHHTVRSSFIIVYVLRSESYMPAR